MIRSILLSLVTFLLSILVACDQNTSDSNATDIPSTSNTTTVTAVATTSETNTENASPSEITDTLPELSESYTAENPLINATLTVQYPAGWYAEGEGTNLLLSSDDPSSTTPSPDIILITLNPITDETLTQLDQQTARAIVEYALLNATGQDISATDMTIGGLNSAIARSQLDDNSALVYAIQFSESSFVIMTSVRAGTFTESEENLILAIAETIQYDAGAIPENNE